MNSRSPRVVAIGSQPLRITVGLRNSHSVMPTSISTMQLKNTATGSVQAIQENIDESFQKQKPLPVETGATPSERSEEHTSELQSRPHLVCRLLLEKKTRILQPGLAEPLGGVPGNADRGQSGD